MSERATTSISTVSSRNSRLTSFSGVGNDVLELNGDAQERKNYKHECTSHGINDPIDYTKLGHSQTLSEMAAGWTLSVGTGTSTE